MQISDDEQKHLIIASWIVHGGPLKSSSENVVEKRNILSLFKLPVVL